MLNRDAISTEFLSILKHETSISIHVVEKNSGINLFPLLNALFVRHFPSS